MTITQQLETLAGILETRETIPMTFAKKALALLDKAPREALQMIVDRKVKFLWKPAQLRLNS